MIRCINLDWLEVFALEDIRQYPLNADYFRRQGYGVDERRYGTRSYSEMFTLLDQQGQPFIEVRRNPVGMFKSGERNYGYEPYGCHLRLVNRYCYYDNAAELMLLFMQRHNYTFSRIAKVDLSLDFEKFDTGDDPHSFLTRYINGKYSKINQSNISAFGKDNWSGRDWNSVSWGALRSPVFTRFYNKSLELRTVKDKPYIRQAWALTGLIDDVVKMTKGSGDQEYTPDIWRVEFSVRSSVKRWIEIRDYNGTKQYRSLRNTLECYYSRPNLLQMFASLANHYFHFKHLEPGKSKYKCPDKVLFVWGDDDAHYTVDKVAADRPADDLIKRLIALLQKFNLLHYDREANKAADVLIEDLEAMQLRNMAVNAYDDDEVLLLRALISRRLNRPEEPYALSKDAARAFVQLEKKLWQETKNFNSEQQ